MGRPFTKKEDQYLRDNYLLIPAKRMAKNLGRTEGTGRQRMKILGLVVPPEIIEQFKKQSYFPKGNKSHNKGKKQTEYMSAVAIEKARATCFPKGNVPHNAKEKDGVITIRHDSKTKRPYKHIRLALGKWEMLHVHKWKKKYGDVPDGMIIVFKDGNPMNCTLKNLMLLSREENMKRNTIHRYPGELKKVIRLNNKLKRKAHEHKKQNQRSA